MPLGSVRTVAPVTSSLRGLAPVMLNQLARYDFSLPLIAEVEPETILEVGSGSEGVARFASQDYRITVSDIDFSDYGTVELGGEDDDLERVEASVTSLPFADRQFDVVLALDLIEHIPPEDRDRALSEIARVARRRAIIGCPTGVLALESDRRLGTIYDRLPRREKPEWLKEHLMNGFPDAADLRRPLEGYGSVAIRGNEQIGSHFAVSVLEATPVVSKLTLGLARTLAPKAGDSRETGSGWKGRLLRFLRGSDRTPTYRQVAVLDRDP